MNKQNKCAIGCFDFFNALSGDTISPGFFSKKTQGGTKTQEIANSRKKLVFRHFWVQK